MEVGWRGWNWRDEFLERIIGKLRLEKEEQELIRDRQSQAEATARAIGLRQKVFLKVKEPKKRQG